MVGRNRQLQSQVILEDTNRTKIIATVGPACDSLATIKQLIENGADGLRLNFSHGSHEERSRQIKWIRQASEQLAKPVAIIQDLQGPKIRLGDFDGVIEVDKGQMLKFEFNADYLTSGHIPTQFDLSTKVKRGERILLFDGRVHTVVTAVKDKVVYAEAINSGMLIKRKGINIPDTSLDGDVLTPKDKADLVFGSSQDIDYVALSFVQSGTDVIKLRRLLNNMNFNAKIISKIETKSAIQHLEEVVRESDVVMIARGDLAVETPPESIPIVQRKIIGLGQMLATPTIVATQMLISMTTELSPSRAEVSDVATAVLLGADCLMLSDETASGNHPVEVVKMMHKIIKYTETHSPLTVTYKDTDDNNLGLAISEAVIKLATNIKARAIVAETKSGATAMNIAAKRSPILLIAVTSDVRTSHQLAIVYSIKAYNRPVDKHAAIKLTDWLRDNKVFNKNDLIVTASGKYPGIVGTTDTIKVRILE